MGRHRTIFGPCQFPGCPQEARCKVLCKRHWLALRRYVISRDRVKQPTCVCRSEVVGWVAGLLEGEACFRLDPYPGITVNMVDEDVIRTLAERVRGSLVTGPHARAHPRHKPYWVWALNRGATVRALLLAVRPWMGARRGARIDEMLARLALLPKEAKSTALAAFAHLFVPPQRQAPELHPAPLSNGVGGQRQ